MKRSHTALLWCMLGVGFVFNTTVLVHLQLFSTPHRLLLHWDSRPAGVGCPDASVRKQAHPESDAHAIKLKTEANPPAAATQNDLRLDVGLWLSYAAADAAQEGTEVSVSCQRTHGANFVSQFRSSCSTLCSPASIVPAQQLTSQVDCCVYPVSGGEGLACRASNIVVNTTSFMGSPPPQGESRHEGYLPQGEPGSVELQCRMHNQTAAAASTGPISDRRLQSEQLPWFKSAVQQMEPGVLQARCSSSGSDVVSHPVMFVTRLDPTNPYHHTQSLVQAFLTLAVLNNSKQLPGIQVILADHFIPGPFLGIWQRLAHPYPVLTMDNPTLANRQICFEDSIHAHYASPTRAFLGYEGIGGAGACPSTVLMAASHWLRYLFREVLPAAEQPIYDAHNVRAVINGLTKSQLLTPVGVVGSRSSTHNRNGNGSSSNNNSSNASRQLRHTNSSGGSSSNDSRRWHSNSSSSTRSLHSNVDTLIKTPQHRRLNVVWLSRSWFGRAMKAGGGLTGWQASRDMSHETEDAIVKGLELAVLEWNHAACAPPAFGWWQKPRPVPPSTGCKPTNVSFNFRAVELSVEDLYPEQVVLLTRTAVLVGIHGAALTNQMWMRPHRGAVVEFGAGGNFHYLNMAAELGHKHFRLDGPNVEALTTAVQQAMDHVSAKYHAQP